MCPPSIPGWLSVGGVFKAVPFLRTTTTTPTIGAMNGAHVSAGYSDTAYIDESGLMIGLAGRSLYALRINALGRFTHVAAIKTDLADGAQHVIGAGRGFFYLVYASGAMDLVQVNATGTAILTFQRIASSGWAGFVDFTSSNDGIFYAIHSNGQFLQYRKYSPWTNANSFGRKVFSTGITAIRELESPGDGVILSFLTDGRVLRSFQADPAGMGPMRTNAIPGWRGWQGVSLIALNPSSCRPLVSITRTMIAKRALAWNGTGNSFCTSHTCAPHAWCIDFAWTQWIESGITRWEPYRTAATTSPSAYGAAHRTSKGRNIRAAQVGDIIVWGPVGPYVGHAAIITRVYGNGRVDIMHGNWAGTSRLTANADPTTLIPNLGPYDDIVSPRL